MDRLRYNRIEISGLPHCKGQTIQEKTEKEEHL